MKFVDEVQKVFVCLESTAPLASATNWTVPTSLHSISLLFSCFAAHLKLKTAHDRSTLGRHFQDLLICEIVDKIVVRRIVDVTVHLRLKSKQVDPNVDATFWVTTSTYITLGAVGADTL